MTIANALASWQKGGTKIGLATSVSSGGTPDIILHDDATAIIADPNKAVIRRSLETGGGPQTLSRQVVIGRARPSGTLRLPLTPINLALVSQSLLQSVSYAASHYTLGAYSSPVTTKWMYAEHGVAGSDSVKKLYGGRVVKFTIEIPAASDDDPGDPMIVADVIWCNAERADAFTAGGTQDTAEPFTGRDLELRVNNVTSGLLIGGSLSFEIGGAKARQINSPTPQQIFAGPLVITGNLSVYASTSNTDLHQTLIDAHEAKTVTEIALIINDTNDHAITLDALIEAPQESSEEGMMTMGFGFFNVNDSSDQPVVTVYTADMGW